MWEQIRSNRIRSFWVISLLALLLIAAGLAFGAAFIGPDGALLGGTIALGLWLFMWLLTVSRGDNILAALTGAREVDGRQLPQLVNVVEEMTIAAGLSKTPRIFLVDDPAPNAFAIGRNPDRAAVAVTTGLLSILDRDELQGVVAHEIGHIKNRDVALMTTAGIMLGAIVLIGDIAMRSLFWGGARRSRSSSGNGNGAVVAIGILFLILTPILAQLLYFALSRRREYLADACGARFSRYPEGLARALEKLGGSRVAQADRSKVTAPMYIVRPLSPTRAAGSKKSGRSKTSAFSTHPSVEERVRILRAMGGGAGYASYEQAFHQVTDKSVIGARTLAAEGASLAAVAPAAAADPVASFTPPDVPGHAAPGPPPPAQAKRARQASDAFLSASGFHMVRCNGCNALLKIPASQRGRVQSCPRCQTPLP